MKIKILCKTLPNGTMGYFIYRETGDGFEDTPRDLSSFLDWCIFTDDTIKAGIEFHIKEREIRKKLIDRRKSS